MASANALILPKRLADSYFGSGTFKMLLTTSVPSEADLDSFDFRNDVANEAVGAGYTAGGFAVTPTVGAVDTANNRVPVTWAAGTPALASATLSNIPGGWIYKEFGSAATDQLIQYFEFTSGLLTVAAEPVIITFNTPLYINR